MVLPTSRGVPFPPPPSEMRVPFPVSSGKDSRSSRRISSGGALNGKVERNSRFHATIPKYPQNSQSTPEEPDFPALPQLSPRVSTHTMVTRVTMLGKASRESRRSLYQHDGKPDTAARAREESGRARPHSRQGLTPLWRLQKHPQIHVSTGEESSGSGRDSPHGLRPPASTGEESPEAP